MILVLYILETVGSWGRPCGIGEFFLTLTCNYDLDLMSDSTFILSRSGSVSVYSLARVSRLIDCVSRLLARVSRLLACARVKT